MRRKRVRHAYGGRAEEGMDQEHDAAVLALLLTPGIGRGGVWRLIAAAERARISLTCLLAAGCRELHDLLPPDSGPLIARVTSETAEHVPRARFLLRQIRSLDARCISHRSSAYPREIRCALGAAGPPLLFVCGPASLLKAPKAAIVGARGASCFGLRLAAACARTCAAEGITVVSGGAAGVDTAAHHGVLVAGGATVVVLPRGLLTYRPPAALRDAVAAGRAVVVSAFTPDAPWAVHAAVTRNATIATLAELVCVIEPKKRGGSFRTAIRGLEQGKTVAVYDRAAGGERGAWLPLNGVVPLITDAAPQAVRFRELWTTRATPSDSPTELF